MAPAPELEVTDGRPRLARLDGLRALAAGSVLLYHVALNCGWTQFGPLAPLLAQAKAGVGVFFVISGCVLWLPWARALAAGAPFPDLPRYLRRRALRILPGYWVALSAWILLPWSSALGADTVRYYGLVQIYSASTLFGGLGVAWSLCVEVTFYVAIVALALTLRGRWSARRRVGPRTQLLVLGAIAAASLAWRAWLAGSPLGPVSHGGFLLMTALPGFADWFALGMALAVVIAARPAGAPLPDRLRRVLARPRWCWGGAWALVVLAAAAQTDDLFLALSGPLAHLLIGLASLAMVASAGLGPAPAGRRGAGAGILASAAMQWLGRVSYGIYLWHMVVLAAVLGGLGDIPLRASSPLRLIAVLVLVGAGAVGCAALSWYAIERPLLRGRATAPVAAATSAA